MFENISVIGSILIWWTIGLIVLMSILLFVLIFFTPKNGISIHSIKIIRFIGMFSVCFFGAGIITFLLVYRF